MTSEERTERRRKDRGRQTDSKSDSWQRDDGPQEKEDELRRENRRKARV